MSETQNNGRLRRPVYDNRISLGNIISAVLIIAAGVVAFSELKGDVRVLAKDIESQGDRLVKVENRVGLGDQVPFERRPQ